MEENVKWKNGYEAALTFSFDDGYKETYDSTVELLSEYDMSATHNVIVGYVGKTFNCIPTANWKQLAKASREYRMEIASHSYTHEFPMFSILDRVSEHLPDITCTLCMYETLKSLLDRLRPITQISRPTRTFNIAEEFFRSKEEIDRHISTQRVKSFVYPGGHYTKQMRKYVKSAGYLSARGGIQGYNQPSNIDFYHLKHKTWGPSTTPSEANKWIDQVLNKGGWLIEVFHLVSRCNKYDYKLFTPFKYLKEHLDCISKKRIWVDTQQNIVKWLLDVDSKRRKEMHAHVKTHTR